MNHLFNAQAWLTKYPHIVIAYSGGRDSAALLHVFSNAAKEMPGTKIEVAHIHHGLQKIADDWILHTQNVIQEYKKQGVPIDLHVYHVNVNTGPQVSVEEEARKERYKALYQCVKTTHANAIALGQHLNDQAETFLLQAARGVGVAGMSSMPLEMQRHDIWRIRPMLYVDRKDIDVYVRENNIAYVDDPTNDENIYRRNVIRNQILPMLRQEIPSVDKAFAKAAQHCAEAHEALQWMGKEDLQKVMERDVFLPTKAKDWPQWRQKNVLRYWYAETFGYPMPSNVLDRIMILWETGGNGRIPCPKNMTLLWSPRRLHLENELLQKENGFSENTKITISTPSFTHDGQTWFWNGPLPATLEYGHRKANLSFSLGENRPPRPLKKQYQAMKLPQEQYGFWYNSQGNVLFAPKLGVNYQYNMLSNTPFEQNIENNVSFTSDAIDL